MANWSVRQSPDSTTLFCSHLGVRVQFEMPKNFSLQNVHPDVLKLCEQLIYGAWDPKILEGYQWTRKPTGSAIGLAYSGGVDSTAALTLLDDRTDLHLFYMQRQFYFDTKAKLKRVLFKYLNRWNLRSKEKHRKQDMHLIPSTKWNQANAMNSISIVEKHRPVLRIKSDFEVVRSKLSAEMPGFSSDLTVFVGALLMADQMGIRYLACGMMLESTYLKKGYEYRSFADSKYWKQATSLFEAAGFKLFFPVLPCGEILNAKISQAGRYQGAGNGCVSSKVPGTACMQCYKCFRKQLLAGKLIPLNDEARRRISKDKIKQGASLVYAYNKYKFDIPELKKYEGLDYSFLEGYYAPALECIPQEFRDYLRGRLNQFAQPMSYDLFKFQWKSDQAVELSN